MKTQTHVRTRTNKQTKTHTHTIRTHNENISNHENFHSEKCNLGKTSMQDSKPTPAQCKVACKLQVDIELVWNSYLQITQLAKHIGHTLHTQHCIFMQISGLETITRN